MILQIAATYMIASFAIGCAMMLLDVLTDSRWRWVELSVNWFYLPPLMFLMGITALGMFSLVWTM